MGIDDVTMADATEPRLTVVAQDPLGMGRAAGELLFARLDGAAGPTERVVMPTELLVRGSGEIRPPAESFWTTAPACGASRRSRSAPGCVSSRGSPPNGTGSASAVVFTATV